MRKQTPIILWIVLLGALLAAFLMMDSARTTGASRDVAISEFISRVESGEVVEVTIAGDRVTGTTTSGSRITSYATDRAELIRVMREKRVAFREEAPSQNGTLLLWILKLAIPLLFLVFLLRGLKGASGQGMLKQTLSSKATLHKEGKVTFADVAGIDEAVEDVKDLVDFLKDPKKFTKLGGRVPKGVLLLGDSGCGKTLLARAVAGEAGVPFFSADASSFVEMFVGVGAARVRDLFDNGRKHAPCIIFIDEIDAVGKKRGGLTVGGGHDEREQTLNQLLIAMDGFAPNEGIIVIGATNRPETLDNALIRPGRFDRRVMVARPDVNGRMAILKVHSRSKPLGPDVDLSIVARGTTGMTGADLEGLLNEAALRAAKRNAEAISMEDIEQAKDKIYMGPERKGVVMKPEEKTVIAYHEGGHTLVGWYSPDCDPVHKVTIIPRGMALGLTQTLPFDDKKLYSRDQLLAEIDMFYGGRMAEELILGENVTTGASNDLERLTNIARKMVTDWGMGPAELGLRTFGEKTRGWFETSEEDYSPETAAAIDKAIKALLDERRERAKKILTDHRDKLDALAALLLEKETVDAAELTRLLGPRPVKEKA